MVADQTNDDIALRVRGIVAAIMEEPLDKIDLESSPDSVDAWDSIQHMNLVLALEQEFGIQFSEEQTVELLSVELIVITVKELV